MLTLAIIFIICVISGAIFGRIDGGGLVKTPEWVERALVMSFFIIACYPFAGYWCAVAGVGMAGIATGHGMYFLAMSVEALSPEWFDFIVQLFFGDDPRARAEFYNLRGLSPKELSADQKFLINRAMQQYGMDRLYRRCVFGMFVTGTVVGLPAALLALYFGAWVPALLFSLTGAAKAAAYVVGWALRRSTMPAEYLNGGLRTALAVAALYAGAVAGGF